MDPLIMIVVAAFIITAVFVGYHAAQEPDEKMAKGHEAPLTINSFSNQAKQVINILFINPNSFQI